MKKYTFFILILSVQFLLAQEEIKFGDVSKEELLEEEYLNDVSANAVVLYKNQKTFFVNNGSIGRLVTKIHERIKIYNKDGFDYATKTINLFKTRHDDESVSKLKAYSYNLENDKIIKTELDKEQIFKTEVSYNYKQVKFTMPNVKEGTVIEFSYQVSSPFLWNIDEFRFQYDIPIKVLLAEIRTPKGFRFKQTFKGNLSFYPKERTERDNRIGMAVNIKNYSLNNVPALKKESYVDNIDNYRAGVMFELVSIELPGYFKSYSQTWKDVAQTIGSSDDYKNQLDKTRSFDEALDEVIAKEPDQLSKMKAIYKYVKDNLTWNNMDGKYFLYGIKKTLKEKKGNAADLNLTLVGMLRYAGINANPVIISTKENAVPFFPTVERLNYVLAYAVINEEKYFLDATDEFSDVNILPIKDYNWRGVLIDNNNKKWNLINIPTPDKAKKMVSVDVALLEDGSAQGKCSSRYGGHMAKMYRENIKNKDEDTFLTEKEASLGGIEISNFNVKNTDSYEGNVNETFEYFDENASEIINNKLYFQPLGFLKKEENPFLLEKREYPVDFGYSFKNTHILNISYPDGYVVESIPKPIIVKIPNNLGVFKYILNIVDGANKLQLMVSYEINSAKLAADVYPYLREFYKQMITKESEQVVLVKS